MSSQVSQYLKFGSVSAIILLGLGYLAFTGVQESKDYYVTIKELHEQAASGDVYTKHLRVAGNVVPGSILRRDDGNGHSHVEFVLVEDRKSVV